MGKTGKLKEVEAVTRERWEHYDGEKVKDFLKDAKLADPRPLIYVCNFHGFVGEMTGYLYSNNLFKYIEVYLKDMKGCAANTAEVAGALLDLDCGEDKIKDLIMSVRTNPALDLPALLTEVEKRNRLKMLTSFLEQRQADGDTASATHDALAKIYIDTNAQPERFLESNQYYDSLIVGAYCEKRDPHLSFVAYRRGRCDDQLVAISNSAGLFKQQARYLVERRDEQLWEKVLAEDNEHRQSLIDQVVGTALPDSDSPEDVAATVQAFMNAEMPEALLELLEKLVLQTSKFMGERPLQNLLLLTAIREEAKEDNQDDRKRVMDYITRLDNYDGVDVANIAKEHELYPEAFAIFKKFEEHLAAISVLVDHREKETPEEFTQRLEQAVEYAANVNLPEVWSKLAGAQLDTNVGDAIKSYIKAEDTARFPDVIARSKMSNDFAALTEYLIMCRKKVKESVIDTELVYAYARTDSLADMEEFISGSNIANVQSVGDRTFDEGMYEAARILYNNVSNFARLASALVKLEKYQEAVDSARKANGPRTWKEVNKACVLAGEFRLAQMCAQHIIVQPDDLIEIIDLYEGLGHFEELMTVIEAGIGLERAHPGIFTELGILYSKHAQAKLMDHIKCWISRMNIPKLILATEQAKMWRELVFLYKSYEEYDNGAMTMMNQPADAWTHSEFKDVVIKVSNLDIYYKAITFYLTYSPKDLTDLLNHLATPTPTAGSRLDHNRVAIMLRKQPGQGSLGQLPLVQGYLESVQKNDEKEVNEAVNDIYIELENTDALRLSIDTYPNFDQISLAQKLQKHELLELRRVSSYVYKKNKRFAESVELSKQDKLYDDVSKTAAESRDTDVAEGVLHYFADNDLKESFAACLYTCYDLLRPDVVMEVSWKKGWTHYAMPFMINSMREMTTRVSALEQTVKELKGDEKGDENGETQPMEGQQAAAAPPMAVYATGMATGGVPVYATGMAPGGVPMYVTGQGVPVAPANPMMGQPGYPGM